MENYVYFFNKTKFYPKATPDIKPSINNIEPHL